MDLGQWGEIIRRLSHTVFHEVTNQDLEKHKGQRRESSATVQRGGWTLKGRMQTAAFPWRKDWTTCLLNHWKKGVCALHELVFQSSGRFNGAGGGGGGCLGMPWLSWSKHMAGSCARPYVKSSQIWPAYFPPTEAFTKKICFTILG